MATTPQNYANHTRWHAAHHFFAMPVLLINVICAIVYAVTQRTLISHWWIVVSVALVLVGVFARTNSLKVQDRVIRLEEQLRYQRLLSPDLASQAGNLTLSQIIALRFASDEELAGLVREILAGKLTKPSDIKRAIKNWRADNLRV